MNRDFENGKSQLYMNMGSIPLRWRDGGMGVVDRGIIPRRRRGLGVG